MIERYRSAERFLSHNMLKLIKNGNIIPCWFSDTEFWFRKDVADGWAYVLYDVAHDALSALFDHDRAAEALSSVSGAPYDADRLPFNFLSYKPDQNTLIVRVLSKSYAISIVDYSCWLLDDPFSPYLPSIAPDGLRCVYTKGYNLWYKYPAEGKEYQLTFDGVKHNSYGLLPDSAEVKLVFAKMGLEQTGGVTWSPDCRKIILCKYDESECEDFVFTETVSSNPQRMCKAHSLKASSVICEKTPVLTYYIIDIETAKMIKIELPDNITLEQGMQMSVCVLYWNADSTKAIVIGRGPAANHVNIMEVDLLTGRCKVIFEERNDTFISLNTLMYNKFNVKVIKGGRELIWFSERSGWGHLYRYELENGELINQVTSGEWLVRDLLAVDEEREVIYFSAGGIDKAMDPYYKQICRVGFNGGNFTVLTPENADHVYTNGQSNPFLGEGSDRFPNLSPGMTYLIDSYSTVNEPPVTVIRKAEDGSIVKTLETADISGLLEIGWLPPERFSVQAANGITDLYGVIYKPSDFDPRRKYPVIDSIYNGPQVIASPTGFMDGLYPGVASAIIAGQDSKAMAELGFIVVGLDPRGTPGRSKWFHDHIFRNYDNFGLDDHIAALQTLGKERPYFDMDRVGVYGHSYGGYASCKAILKYPEVFKVCVSSAAVHEFRRSEDIASQYYANDCSEEEYDHMDNTLLVENLKGKLLLAYGEHDENVRYDQYTHMADALIKANKEYDLIYIPNETHRFSANLYFRRRRMDYFVRNLMGVEPPKDYVFHA
jgi:hypothetical protein